MSEDRRTSTRTSSHGPGVTHDQAGHAIVSITRPHGNATFKARRR